MNNTVKIAAGIVFLGVAAIALIMAFQDNGNQEPMPLGQMNVDTSGEARQITMIKYNDFQCPTCKVFKQWEDILLEEPGYADLVTIEYRHYPLNMHPNALPAARAAEAAKIQGHFSEMKDRLFDNQAIWSGSTDPESIFITYAEEIGLDTEQFVTDMQSEEVASVIERELAEGNRRLVPGTPTYFIDGQKIPGGDQGPRNYSQFKLVVDMFLYR